MTNKIIITKPGYNAMSETNPDNIVFSSDYNTLKYDTSGSESISIIGDGTLKQTTVTKDHNLGYVPFFIVYVDDFINGNAYYSLIPYVFTFLSIDIRAEAWVDSTKLYLRFTNKSTSTYTAHFHYKVFRNNLGF